MASRVQQVCQVCGSTVGFNRSDDGFFYCGYCNSRADDFFDTGLDEEQFFSHYSASCSRARTVNAIAAEPIPQVKLTTSQYLDHPDIPLVDVEDNEGDEDGPTGPSDFGSPRKKFTYDEYYSEIRSRYSAGLQIMIQLQCQALVEKFNASPLIIGLVGPLWLRFLASTGVMADKWADRAVNDSEAQTQGEDEKFQPSANYRSEPVNIHGKRVVYIWYRSLRSTLPLSCSLAISFLVCHIAREPITPSDMLKWALEGKLPYFAAFNEIGKHLGSRSEACPISVSRMFRPNEVISSQKLESMAADIAKKIGLELPPVNFYAIASRYCQQLYLPSKEILPLACRVCEWSTPAELYLSTNELRIPTRVYVMSILIVTIRIVFDINGYGMWESSLNATKNGDEDSPSENPKTFGVVELLQNLETKYDELDDVHAYSEDLSSYLHYCKEVVFSGLRPSYEDLEEEKLLEEFWEFYQKSKAAGSDSKNKRSRDTTENSQEEITKRKSDESRCSTSQNSDECSNQDHDSTRDVSHKERAIKRLKLDMDDHKFYYIPPRSKVKRRDYLHYARKRKDVYVYAVHADYYILLRSCAKVAQIETRIMHIAVLSLERRLQWLEKRIDSSLQLRLNLDDDVCEFCKEDDPARNACKDDDPIILNI